MTGDDSVLVAVGDEADASATALSGLPAPAWERPTRCVPWRVRELVGHVITALGRVPDAVAEPVPDRPDTTATTYYRADERFSGEANADRVRTARDRAAAPDVATLARQFADALRHRHRRHQPSRGLGRVRPRRSAGRRRGHLVGRACALGR